MAFSDAERRRIERLVGGFCRRRMPAGKAAGPALEYAVTGHRIILLETRAHRTDPSAPRSRHPVAKMTFVRKAATWRLFWPRTPRKWNSYSPLPGSAELRDLVREIERDRHCCFFG